MIVASREDIAEQPWLHKEHDLARAVLDTDDTTHRRIMELAAEPSTGSWPHCQVDQLLVAAAVEVLTGARRQPRRWRARSEDRLSSFWRGVGPDRDRRSQQDPVADVLRFLDEG
ncbi:hypothetical protein [Geodermatophilus chilensis]|uniref:hypothetical protein n=1 Tax=Geodermatophilus chilensis TaxID=2035835 RepID=UPI0012FFE091|nr:hypothetical protein [Geodermatophilus chilensis]